MSSKRFKTAFMTESGRDITAILPYADNVRVLSDRRKNMNSILPDLVDILNDFNPDTDVIIPVGRTANSFLIGVMLSRVLANRSISFGIYYDGDYKFMRI